MHLFRTLFKGSQGLAVGAELSLLYIGLANQIRFYKIAFVTS